MKIAIIGGGWYGCHIAAVLKNNHEITLYEKDHIFSGISSKNQNRLHLGYHYPRSFVTRKESREGFEKFIEKYGHLTKKVKNNYYSVHNNSLVDYETYISIFKYENYDFEVTKNNTNEHLSDFIKVDERQILHLKARKHFEDILRGNIKNISFNKNQITNYDLVIDCTCNQLYEFEKGFEFERFIYFVIQSDIEINPLIVMDGDFYSIFPIESIDNKNLYTFTHVRNGVLLRGNKFNIVDKYYLSKKEEIKNYELSIDDYCRNNLDIDKNDFSLVSAEYATKIKMKKLNDARTVQVIKHKNVLTIIPGKIDAIFTAEDMINEYI